MTCVSWRFLVRNGVITPRSRVKTPIYPIYKAIYRVISLHSNRWFLGQPVCGNSHVWTSEVAACIWHGDNAFEAGTPSGKRFRDVKRLVTTQSHTKKVCILYTYVPKKIWGAHTHTLQKGRSANTCTIMYIYIYIWNGETNNTWTKTP